MKSLKQRLLAGSGLLNTLLLLVVSLASTEALAFSSYQNDFDTNYGTAGTRISNCGLCHVNFNGGGLLTQYGVDFRNNNYSISAIGTFDSDGDGTSNDAEAAQLFMPSFSCGNLVSAQNPPAGLANFVDPNNPGCVGSGAPPIVNINGPYVGSTGVPIQFSSAGSTDPDGTIVAYFWDFGSGYGTSTEANPLFTYNLNFQATILVTLTITDDSGNIATDTTFVTVLQTPNSPPVANAGAPVTGVVNAPVQFDGTGSSDPEGTALSYSWDFGDGASATGFASPTHAYSRCGTYNVDLTVTDGVGLTGTASTSATIASSGVDIPTAHAGGGTGRLYNGTVGSNVQFDGSGSSDPDCNIVSYSWDFGDGTTGTGLNPLHSYSSAGTYIVTLTVTDNDGLQATDVATVTVIDTGPLDGQALYDANCGNCHGFGANSTKVGAGVTRINNGIVNEPSMNSLSFLSAAEVQAIADYLISLVPPPPPGGSTGEQLYDANCGGCHGFGANSTKAGADVTRINNGIANEPSMNFLSSLPAADVQSIADYLVSLAPPPPPPGGSTGEQLYDANCGSCHGFGANSTKAGADLARINAGIVNVPSMNFLSSLPAADLQAIADYLVSLAPPPPPPGGSTGEQLYDTNCGSCHGFGANSTKAGADLTRINNGIANEPSMNFLSSLPAADIQSIADYLTSLAPPTSGSGLYATYCGSCHGADGSGGTSGEDVRGDSASDISEAIQDESEMQYLSFLTSQEIQLISDFLDGDTTPPPPPPGGGNGQTLYDNNCGSCHGFGAASTKAGADVTRINNSIVNVPSMNFLSSMPASDIQAIADYLVSLAPPPPPGGSTGQQLYDNNCGGCHGFGANSSKAGADVTRINNGITNDPSMSFLSTLPASDIQSIADYLATLAPPTTPSGLYAAYCAACHGVDGSGGSSGEDVRGDSASDISEAIQDESEMQYLSFLTSTEIQLISDFLDGDTTPPPPPPGGSNGQQLYDSNCGSCHGFGAASTKAGADVTRINNGIVNAPSMNFLSSLPASDIQAIADYLVSLAPPPPPPPPGGTNGQQLYDTHCGSCHGFGSNTSKAGADVTRINNGIQNVPSMNSLASLPASDIQAMADYLVSLAPTQPPTGPADGATLYTNNCAGCHGPGTNSSKVGADVTRINSGIVNEPSMGYLSFLTASDIQAIADYLATAPTPTTPDGLYATHCGSCHGADGSGGTSGEDVRGDSASSISEAIESEAEMQYLSFLSSKDIAAIASFLDSSGGGGGGEGDEELNWRDRKGHIGITTVQPVANSGSSISAELAQAIQVKPAVPAAKPQAASQAIAGPSLLSPATMSATEVQVIEDFLTSRPVEVIGKAKPKALYTSNCASCHGEDGSGGISGVDVRGELARDLIRAIKAKTDMSYLDSLTTSDIEAIERYLGSRASVPYASSRFDR